MHIHIPEDPALIPGRLRRVLGRLSLLEADALQSDAQLHQAAHHQDIAIGGWTGGVQGGFQAQLFLELGENFPHRLPCFSPAMEHRQGAKAMEPAPFQ